MQFIYMSVLFFCFVMLSYSQDTDNIIGKKHSIESKILNENRDIQIYVPESYNRSQKKYPVLYILDGQRLFFHGVSLAQTLNSFFQIAPDFIVVGISNKYPDRFRHFGSIEFLDFIEHELISYIDNKYRTSDERLIYGWEYAGGFVIETMIKRPQLFSAHIAASPFPILEKWSVGNKSRLDLLTEKFEQGLSSFLYFSVGSNEGMVEDGTTKLEKTLQMMAPKSLDWHYRVLEGEEHRSTAHSTLYQALKSYFNTYEILHFNRLEEFYTSGGMKYLQDYYDTRAKRFGFSSEIMPWTMFTLVRCAMEEDNFEQFDTFMNAFQPMDLLSKISLKRAVSVAKFYLKHQQFDRTIDIYQNLIENNPDDPRVYNSFGDVYVEIKDKTKAIIQYKKAVSLAQKMKDENTARYKSNLEAAQKLGF